MVAATAQHIHTIVSVLTELDLDDVEPAPVFSPVEPHSEGQRAAL